MNLTSPVAAVTALPDLSFIEDWTRSHNVMGDAYVVNWYAFLIDSYLPLRLTVTHQESAAWASMNARVEQVSSCCHALYIVHDLGDDWEGQCSVCHAMTSANASMGIFASLYYFLETRVDACGLETVSDPRHSLDNFDEDVCELLSLTHDPLAVEVVKSELTDAVRSVAQVLADHWAHVDPNSFVRGEYRG